MKWKQIIAVMLLASTLTACSLISGKQAETTAPNTDPYAGTRGEDHIFLGANIPFGTVQIGPRTHGSATNAGYNYNDSIITGFILSYTGEGEESLTINHDNDIRFFPSTMHECEATFLHKYEVAKPGYYSIFLHQADIAIELTTTKHTVFQRYFFPPMDSVQVAIDQPLRVINDSTLRGQTPSTHFIVQFSRPTRGIQKGTHQTKLFFDATEEEMLYIKVGISPESVESALSYLKSELPDWDYEQAAARANKAWNDYLIKE